MMGHKVYVMLGFHINFYHSWRGDTPDEAGFGTDMRVIRGVLDILDRANSTGKKARGYWDTEVFWTFQEILPKHCPDILERMRARVAAGQDEIVLGPFNNGANHAATSSEFRAAVEWAIENPWGSGLRQLFPRITPFYRPQESVFTTGQETILKQCGVEGLILYYALVPFNTLGAFTPALSLEERHNPFWFRSHEDQPPLVVFPAMSAADVLELVSLENMMLDLHARQESGEINSDVVIHLNEDADLESWLPFKMPAILKWFPNTGGLEEYIHLVNKYPWADFTVPSEYLANHPPLGEVLVRQDLADGGFDGSYSWAEKCSSLRLWTILEQSRLSSCRAEALAKLSGLDLRDSLWEGMDSSFFQRLIGLTTTHFGMSTPVINEERQARAFDILGGARQIAVEAEREAALTRLAEKTSTSEDVLYDFELLPTPPDRDLVAPISRVSMRVPLILPHGVQGVQLRKDDKVVPASITDWIPLPGGNNSCEIRFVVDLDPSGSERFQVVQAEAGQVQASRTCLKNQWLDVEFSDQTGIASFRFQGQQIGAMDFLQPFISYRQRKKPIIFPVKRWEFMPLPGEQWFGAQRVRMRAYIPLKTRDREFFNEFTYTFTLFDDLPHLYVDVQVRYASTPALDTIHNMTQKLRRLMDLRWEEVAPFQVHPAMQASPKIPLRIWKHNYLGITAFYDLNYGSINPLNANLDSFNHQVTAGWVAVTNGQHGLLLGENADVMTSMAFCPMRLREESGKQNIWLNPFGSYYGKLASYSHLGATGLGADFLKAFSGFLKPNGPSYNGQSLQFSIMLAPYPGDEPPVELQAAAGAHFYPPGLVFHRSPEGVEAILPGDIRQAVESILLETSIATAGLIPAPTAFLVNPSKGQANLVWELPRDVPVTGLEVAWQTNGELEWQTEKIGAVDRWQVMGLEDGTEYSFKLRAVSGSRVSAWTPEQTCSPGATTGTSIGGGFFLLPPRALFRLISGSLWSAFRSIRRR